MKTEFAKLYTPEGENLPAVPWNVYPRPQMKRDSFFCLNGEWDIIINEGSPEKIIVPFAPESLLSGIGRGVGVDPKLY